MYKKLVVELVNISLEACLATLDEWGIRQQVRGLVFDTTASNQRETQCEGVGTLGEHNLCPALA